MVEKGKEFEIFFDILNAFISFTFGLFMGTWVFLNNIINYSSEKLFIAWDYVMEKTNRKKFVKDFDNNIYAVNYFILFPPTFKSYFNLVVCKLINAEEDLDNLQFKTIITYEPSMFNSWYFLLLNRNLTIKNEDKNKIDIHIPGFYIKSSTLGNDSKDKIVIDKPVWGLVLHYDLKNKNN
jgi:hypothetical protein